MGKLSPGERAHNWAQAIMLLWPLILALVGGTVYGNSETVKRWIHGNPLPEIEGNIDPIIGEEIHPEVRQKIATIIVELQKLKESQARIESRSHRDDHKLSERVEKIEKLVN